MTPQVWEPFLDTSFMLAALGGQQGPVVSTVTLLSSHLGAPRMSHEHDEYSCIMYELNDVRAGYHELPHVCMLMADSIFVFTTCFILVDHLFWNSSLYPSFDALISSFRHRNTCTSSQRRHDAARSTQAKSSHIQYQ